MKSIKTDKVVELVQAAASQISLSAEDQLKLVDMVKDLLPSEDEDGEEKAPRQKNQFAVLVSDPEGRITSDHVAWVFTLPEDESVATVEGKVRTAAHAFNATPKGRSVPVANFGEAIENIGARFFKEQGIAIKSKVPVVVMRTNNQLGEAPSF